MTDLTEQWKKGELPDGEYYVENNNGEIGRLGWSEFAGWYNIKKVLAKVPSYEEWFKMKNLGALTSLLQEKNIECLHRENKLKELLKEAKKREDIAVEQLKDTYTICFRNKDSLLHTPEHNIIGGIERDCASALQKIKKINQALGED